VRRLGRAAILAFATLLAFCNAAGTARRSFATREPSLLGAALVFAVAVQAEVSFRGPAPPCRRPFEQHLVAALERAVAFVERLDHPDRAAAGPLHHRHDKMSGVRNPGAQSMLSCIVP